MNVDQKYAPGCLTVPALFAALTLISTPLFARTLIFQSEDHVVTQPAYSTKANESPVASGGPLTASVAEKQESVSVVTSSASANSELFFMVEELQEQIKSLRGLLEEQGNEIRHLKRNAKARYLDLDARVLSLTNKAKKEEVASKVEGQESELNQAVDLSGVEGPSARSNKSSDAEKIAYQEAYSLIKEKKFDSAVTKLYEFIEKYPSGVLTANAYYWLGEVYLVLPKLEQARQAFSIVVLDYPNHNKAADSLFKLGVAYDRLQNPSESQKYLTEVQKKYPDSTAAKLAKSYKINR